MPGKTKSPLTAAWRAAFLLCACSFYTKPAIAVNGACCNDPMANEAASNTSLDNETIKTGAVGRGLGFYSSAFMQEGSRPPGKVISGLQIEGGSALPSLPRANRRSKATISGVDDGKHGMVQNQLVSNREVRKAERRDEHPHAVAAVP